MALVLKLVYWLLSNLIENGGVYLMSKNINKGWVTLILGPLTGLLVASGHLDGSNASVVLDEFNTLAGALITIATVLGALSHEIQLKKLDTTTTTVTPVVPTVTVTTPTE